jgi:dTDP-4-amino-4,6-dideoxygalactose transaminase
LATILFPARQMFSGDDTMSLGFPQRVASEEARSEPIPFYRPYFCGREIDEIAKICSTGGIGSDGSYTRECAKFLETCLSSRAILMASSCTSALELAARLLNLGPGDEVIMPSFTFSSTANAILLTGAIPVFVDIRPDTCNIDETAVAAAITSNTKAMCVVHYAGVPCDMDSLIQLARAHGIAIIEDAAQAVGSTYKGQFLGTIGDLGAYSFHYTKNFHCGEGGAISVNDPSLLPRAHVIREKGTNRQQFLLGQVDKYTWVDIGLSLPPSELSSAFLLPQLQSMELITRHRREAHEYYMELLDGLAAKGLIRIPIIPVGCESNYHLFRINVGDADTRNTLMTFLSKRGIQTTFHYIPLHSSPMGRKCKTVGDLRNTDKIAATLIRLPFFVDITRASQRRVAREIHAFFGEVLDEAL